jgi:hypothetical protein
MAGDQLVDFGLGTLALDLREEQKLKTVRAKWFVLYI